MAEVLKRSLIEACINHCKRRVEEAEDTEIVLNMKSLIGKLKMVDVVEIKSIVSTGSLKDCNVVLEIEMNDGNCHYAVAHAREVGEIVGSYKE